MLIRANTKTSILALFERKSAAEERSEITRLSVPRKKKGVFTDNKCILV